MSALMAFILHSAGSSSHSIIQEKEIKIRQLGKKGIKQTAQADDIIIYIENSKNTQNTF